MAIKNKGGRPALPDAEKSKVRSMRLTYARWDKLKRPNPAISGGKAVPLESTVMQRED